MIIRFYFKREQHFIKEEAAKLVGVVHNEVILNKSLFQDLKILGTAFPKTEDHV